MARIRSSLWTWLIVVVSAGPAVVFVPRDTRLFVIVAGIGGALLGFALVRLLSSGLLTDPSWRRPTRWGWRWLGRRQRREYVIPAELPPPPGLLIGRDAEVNQIIGYLNGPPAAAARVAWIFGPAGVGKSSLAIGVAQLLTDRYRDGQLLARLDRATTDEGVVDVLRMFVIALGGPSDKVPDGEEKLRRRYRDLTSSSRVLVILDGATNPDHVLRLLPHGRACAALVTAREPWPEMPDWLPVPVDRLDQQAALRVLDALVGQKRVAAEPGAARRIVEAAAGNPFALQLAGVALAARHNWTLRLALRRMSEVQLPMQHRENMPAFMPALNLSFALLTAQEQRAFALLGLLEEGPFAPWALGALLRGAGQSGGSASTHAEGTDAVAERILDRLVRARLVARRIDDATGLPKFRIPEQIRSYVRARMRSDLDVAAREAAADKLDNELLARGERSAELLLRNQVYLRLQAGDLPAALTTAHEALAMCAERLQRASREEERDHALSEQGLVLAALAEVNVELGWLEEAREYAEQAVRAPNARSRPPALRCLSVVQRRLHRLAAAEDYVTRAEVAWEEFADTSERIRIRRERAMVQLLHRDTDAAGRTVNEAIELCEASDAPARRLPPVLWTQGAVLMANNELAAAEETLVRADLMCGDAMPGVARWQPWIRHQRALVALEDRQPGRARELALRASEGFRDMHHRYGIAHCRLVMGRAFLSELDYPAAIAILEEALQTFVGCGDRWAEADTRLPLAEALRRDDRPGEAVKALVQAAQDFDDLGDIQRRNLARGSQAKVERELHLPADAGPGRWVALALAGVWNRDRDAAALP
jgi:tetratricopeptide (TPR) repeat protein